jgi:GrpB-like predicted nucleotidyltransferase (UPF0157 family)
MVDLAHPNFRAEQNRIAGALNLPPERIEHIGSTAVPGLGAKPIVDIMVGSDAESDFQRCVTGLATLGFEHRGDTAPGALYNRKEGPPRVNAHLTIFGGEFWRDHILFRDYLRSDPETAKAYEALKLRILDELGPDPPAYNAAKASFIADVVRAARDYRFAGCTSPE